MKVKQRRNPAMEHLRTQGWVGLAAAIIHQAAVEKDFDFFHTPWARMLAEGIDIDIDRLSSRLKAAQDKDFRASS